MVSLEDYSRIENAATLNNLLAMFFVLSQFYYLTEKSRKKIIIDLVKKLKEESCW